MIRVNNKWEVDWQPDLSVEALLQQCNFTYRHLVVSVNGEVVPPADYSSRLVRDGDTIRVTHVISGG